MGNVLMMQDVYASYQDASSKVDVLHGMNLNVEAGEAVAIMGESGIGKTTAALCILGELPFTGTITVCGKLVTPYNKRSAKERQGMARLVQAVFQDPLASLDPLCTVQSTLTEPLEIHKIGSKAQRIDDAKKMLGRVGLDCALLKRRPHELSGGQRQRVLIAASLMLHPALLIADEVTSSLDKASCDGVLDLLSSLNKNEGLAILFISHDAAAAQRLCSTVVTL